jgi:scyllo-inositol 2-dehydrogenase (NADP+)
MRLVVIGLGVQGRKRLAVAGGDVVATVDPIVADAGARSIHDIPLESFDAACVCTPDDTKLDLLRYLLAAGKHVLVEKPLLGEPSMFDELAALARSSAATCYTAYNHRFEPHLIRLRDAVCSGSIGEIYQARFFYGNGTARDVRNSPWRDGGLGVLSDLGSHLLDLALFLFAELPPSLAVWSANRFENRSFDHVIFGSSGKPVLEFEMSLLSWRNSFRADVFGSEGSLHVDGLCKWGPSIFTSRRRVLPSGRPAEEREVLEQPDPTWAAEYRYFVESCATGAVTIDNDRRVDTALRELGAQCAILT